MFFFINNITDLSLCTLCSPQAIPYVGTIPEGIKPDMAVCFQGTVPADSDQFAINFKTGSSDGDDVALHFNPRIGQKVTLNSFRNGKWESEESASAEPFTRGAPFTMFFTINTEGYEVFVNGVKHCMFKHRIPVEKVSTLNIVESHLENIIIKCVILFFFIYNITDLSLCTAVSPPGNSYVGTIPEGIKPDMAVCFQGTVPADSDQFAINFKTGSSDGDDVALHFNPLIGQKVTLSSCRNGKWESEESASAEPFTRSSLHHVFSPSIQRVTRCVFVNGVKHCMFKHRIPVEKVSTLNIGGDVSLEYIW
uniref:Galectin n=1 Tax=Astyanax mexicanus TaxID=7994 RepID=A0A3B1IUQ4_ASTMX